MVSGHFRKTNTDAPFRKGAFFFPLSLFSLSHKKSYLPSAIIVSENLQVMAFLTQEKNLHFALANLDNVRGSLLCKTSSYI